MANLINLSLVDRDPSRRAAVSFLLSQNEIHTELFEDVGELSRHCPRPGLVLVYDDGCTLSAVLNHMSMTGTWMPVVGFAEEPATRMVVQAVLNGAIDYVAWPCGIQQLVQVLSEAEGRAETIGGSKLREAIARSRVERLTKREREVLSGVAGGFSNRVIGTKLSISPRTVEIHRANMLQKMGANHTSEAIRVAVEAALVV